MAYVLFLVIRHWALYFILMPQSEGAGPARPFYRWSRHFLPTFVFRFSVFVCLDIVIVWILIRGNKKAATSAVIFHFIVGF